MSTPRPRSVPAPTPRRRGWLPAVFVAVAVVAAACGSDAGESAETTSAEDVAVTSEPAAANGASTSGPATTESSAAAGAESSAPSSVDATVAETSSITASSEDPEPTETTRPEAPQSTETTSVPLGGGLRADPGAGDQVVLLAFESRVGDVASAELEAQALAVLNDERGWPRAGFRFEADPASPFRVVLAEGGEVDALCLPLQTYGTVSCQNGPVVALNASRWRTGVEHWDGELLGYRGYLINHEVGHLLGQRHPRPRCPVAGRPAGVMEQQTAGLEGCVGNAWPRDWEIELAARRPVVYAPLPDWGPDPVPVNGER